MKSLILALTLLTSLSAFGQNFYVTNNLAASNHVAVTTPHIVQSITLWSTNATPTIVRLYDGDLTYVTAAYTNRLTYPTNIVTVYTNTGGTTNSLTNRVLYTLLQAVAAATNNSPVVASVVVPSSSTLVTFEPPNPLFFAQKMTLSNDLAGVNLSIQYRQP